MLDHSRESLVNFEVDVDDFIMLFILDTNKVTYDQFKMKVKGAYTRLAR